MKESNVPLHGGELKKETVIDFSVNLNPLGCPIELSMEDIKRSVSQYPDRNSSSLTEKIAKREGVSKECILVTNGASEIISLLALSLWAENALIVEPSFSGYERGLSAAGTGIERCFLQEEDDFLLGTRQVKEIENFLTCHGKSLGNAVFICNPNNPTGRLVSKNVLKEVLDICSDHYAFIVVDESFIEFTKDASNATLSEYISEFPRLFIIRSFTKLYSIPGIRLGYGMCSDKNLMDKMRLLQPEWSVSTIAQAVGEQLLDQDLFISKSLDYIEKEKEFLKRELNLLNIKCYKSDANFLLIKAGNGAGLEKKLLQSGVYLRNCSNFHGLFNGFYRIAIRNHEDNKGLIEALKIAVTD